MRPANSNIRSEHWIQEVTDICLLCADKRCAERGSTVHAAQRQSNESARHVSSFEDKVAACNPARSRLMTHAYDFVYLCMCFEDVKLAALWLLTSCILAAGYAIRSSKTPVTTCKATGRHDRTFTAVETSELTIKGSSLISKFWWTLNLRVRKQMIRYKIIWSWIREGKELKYCPP